LKGKGWRRRRRRRRKEGGKGRYQCVHYS